MLGRCIFWMYRAAYSKTEASHNRCMEKIKEMNTAMHDYLSPIEKMIWCQYPVNKTNIMLFHLSTSNGVETEMHRFNKLGIRFRNPLDFFKDVIDFWYIVMLMNVCMYICFYSFFHSLLFCVFVHPFPSQVQKVQ